MYGLYQNNMYRVTGNAQAHYLVTASKEKALAGFQPYDDGSLYIHAIEYTNEKLTDLFEASIWVIYDCGEEKVQKEWRLFPDDLFLQEDQVRLEYYRGGALPGFTPSGVGECFRYIKISELQGCIVRKEYLKKNGVLEAEAVVEEEKIELSELQDVLAFYHAKNI